MDPRHWVGTWTTAPAPAEGVAFSNHTLRMNVRASLGGDRVRVRLVHTDPERGFIDFACVTCLGIGGRTRRPVADR